MSLPLQKAKYQAQAVAISFGRSSNANPQVAVTWEVVNDQDLAGETITWIGHFTDKTAARTIESLQHAGWRGEDLSELDGLDEQAVRSTLPETVEIVCDPEEYEGEWHLRVQWVNRLGGGRFAFKDQLSGADLKQFGAQMRATVKSVRAGGGAPARSSSGPAQRQLPGGSVSSRSSTSQRHPNAPGNNDDVPF